MERSLSDKIREKLTRFVVQTAEIWDLRRIWHAKGLWSGEVAISIASWCYLGSREVRVSLVILLSTSGVLHFVLLWPGSSTVNALEREHQMTNAPGSCWAFICHVCLSDKALPAGRKGQLTGSQSIRTLNKEESSPLICINYVHLLLVKEKK